MLWYFSSFLQTSWFFKTNNCPFCNKTTQDSAEFWEISENLKAKTKTEDEGILKKKGYLDHFRPSTLPKLGKGMLPTFAMWSTQMPQVHEGFWRTK